MSCQICSIWLKALNYANGLLLVGAPLGEAPGSHVVLAENMYSNICHGGKVVI